MATRKKNYLNNGDLLKQLEQSRIDDKLTDDAVKMLRMLVDNFSTRFSYKNEMDRDDCKQEAMFAILRYWRSFDPEKSTNAFAYFTQIAKRGMAQAFNRLHKDDATVFIFDDVDAMVRLRSTKTATATNINNEHLTYTR